jgi:hypothetical protein
MRIRNSTTLTGLLAAFVLLLGLGASAAQAAPVGAAWQISTMAPSNVAEGQTFKTSLQFTNEGEEALDASIIPVTLSGQMPAGVTIDSVEAIESLGFTCTGDTHAFTCTSTGLFFPPGEGTAFFLPMSVEASIQGPRTAFYEIEGGAVGNPSAATAETTLVSPDPATFGIKAFDLRTSADASGTPHFQAGGHPYDLTIAADFHSEFNPAPIKGNGWPVEPLKDVVADFPVGLIADPTVAATCTLGQLGKVSGDQGFTPEVLCSEDSQIGTIAIRTGLLAGNTSPPLPLYNMVPPPDVPARFGFNVLGTVVIIDATVRPGDHYRATSSFHNISEGLGIDGSIIKIWGTPAAPEHTFQRACVGSLGYGEKCPSSSSELAFVRNPTACTPSGQGLGMKLRAASYQDPGNFDELAVETHLPKGYPFPLDEWGEAQGPTGCDAVPFEPTVSIQPTTQRADSPTGLDFEISLPQSEEPETLATSDLKKVVVTFPKGMTLNPSSVDGLESCAESEIRLEAEGPANCPSASKIGSVEIVSPLLDETIDGAVYLAKQGENKFGSLIAVYIVAEQHGVILKLGGEVALQADGQLVATFDDQPQLPFEDLHVKFFSGPRAALRTPSSCRTYATHASLSPWAGTDPVALTSEFAITSGPSGGPCPGGALDPSLTAGTVNPIAGTYSPLQVRVTRPDASEELSGLSLTLPPGLLGRTIGIPYCPSSALAAISAAQGGAAFELATPQCPAASQVGTAMVGAGAGATPFYLTTGKVYYAGPYKGAPISIAVVAPALAGPFDLGTVVVRAGLRVDPETARITVVSDPIPTALYGIPLDVRDIRVSVDRPNFTINPTNCDALSVDADIAGVSGASAQRSDRFQVAGCDRLGFKPKLSLEFKGKTHRRAHPRLIANLRGRAGDANIASAQVKLPAAAFLDNAHIGTVCTRPDFAAQRCPTGSIYGKASATSPLLDYPVAGPVYLRSNPAHKLPDLVVALRGPYTQPIEVALAGKTDSVKGALRNTFEAIPDVPVKRFHLELFGGKRGLIELSSGLCAHPNATILLDGQNGKAYDTNPAIKAACGKKAHRQRHAHKKN